MSAKDMFYKQNKRFSDAENKAFAREDLIFNVTEDLLLIMEEQEITKSELARRLSKSKSYVSQILSGSRNMTLGTFSDICFELDFKPEIRLPVEVIEPAVPVVRSKDNVTQASAWSRTKSAIAARANGSGNTSSGPLVLAAFVLGAERNYG